MLEIDEPNSKAEALGALTHAWRTWHSSKEVTVKEDRYVTKYEKLARSLGASEFEVRKANLLGAPEKDRQKLLETFSYLSALIHKNSTEEVIDYLKIIIQLRDEFGLKDPFPQDE